MSRLLATGARAAPPRARCVAHRRRPVRCRADDVAELEPRHPMRVFVKSETPAWRDKADDDEEPDPPTRYESDPNMYAFNHVDVSRARRRWLSHTPFLTAQLGGEHDVRVVLFVADDSTVAGGLCQEAERMLGGLEYAMVSVFAEEVYFLVHRLEADVMMVTATDVKLARMATNDENR